jgi:CubicO group peptidase (beta-lactamase class C family)
LPAPEGLPRRLERTLRERQADRLPSIAGAVVRAGETVWSGAVGHADLESGTEATPGTQYRIGSITKTFTAVSIMRLRDEAKLDLDDRLEQHLPGIALGAPTLRRMLSHLSGLQREVGDMFVTGEVPTIEQVVDAMAGFEQVLPAARSHHYSNLAYGLLGEVVARLSGVSYTRYVDESIFAPLGLTRTTWVEHEPNAVGYLVDEYTGTAAREPNSDMGGIASMGQVWSTVGDLARWGAFLVDGDDRVLPAATLDEMWAPQSMVNPDDWTVGWGLGLGLINQSGRIFGGHTGSMPGFLAALFLNRQTKTGAAVLTNAGTRALPAEIALELAEATIELWPPEIDPWRPESPPPPEIEAILGRWWSEGYEHVFSWEGGKLTARMAGAPKRIKPTVFEPLPDGGFRAVEGRESGERLRVDGDRMVWGGYPFSRTQERTRG